MSKGSIGVGVVVLALGAAAFYAQHRDTAGLRREIELLRTEIQGAMTAARASVAAPVSTRTGGGTDSDVADRAVTAGERDDIARLREEIVALRKSTVALTQFAQNAQAAQALAKTSNSVATKLVPVNEWKNAGKGTPEASTETVLWAAVGGDVETLASALTFTDSARAKADAWFAGLSESTRQQYGSPEKVLALMIARDAEGVSGMQVIGQKQIASGDVGLRLRFANADGKTKDETFLMRQSGDGWRMVLPDGAVEKYAGQLSGVKRGGK